MESPALPDTINGVLIETQLPGTAEGEAGLWKKLTFRQHYTNHFTNQIVFQAGKLSPWRDYITSKDETDMGGCAPLSKRVTGGWTDKENKIVWKSAHNEFMTQHRAAAITRPKRPRRKKEQTWQRKLRLEMLRLPPLPPGCPLCGQADSTGHVHACPELNKLVTHRHNTILEWALEETERGKHGTAYLAGDGPERRLFFLKSTSKSKKNIRHKYQTG